MNKSGLLVCLVFLVAFGLRCYDISYPDFRWMDEQGHVPAATHYWESGQFEPDNWEHPPLRHTILYGFLQVFGDNPHGWRMRNVLFGAAAAALTCLFARLVSGSTRTGVLAGLLLATDPLHIVLSRFTFEEIYGGAFYLASVVLYLKHDRRSWMLVLSALLLGCAVAIKWYFVPCWLLVYLLNLWEKETYRDIRSTLFVTVCYVALPLSVYLLSFYPWFGRGYSLGELAEFTRNAYHSLQHYRPENFESGLFFLTHVSASEWFTAPVMVGQGNYRGDGYGEFILYLNNLPVWILTIPSLVAMAVMALKRRSLTLAFPVLLFGATYGLYLFVSRPAFIYSVVPLLPFAFTAIAYGVSLLADRYGNRIYLCALGAVLAWNLYLYPLVTAKTVPVAPYQFILDRADVMLH